MTSPAIAAPPSAGARGLARVQTDTWVMLAIIAIAGLQFAQIFTRAINWDEFWHYNHIVRLHAGSLDQVIQRFHAFAFSWATALPGSNIDHIIVIRMVMFGAEMVTVAALVGVVTHFTDRRAGLLAALAYLSFPYVLQYGASFRYDPPVTAVLMSLLWVLVTKPLTARWIGLGAALVAFLPLISVKAVLYAPVIGGAAFLAWSRQGYSISFVGRMAALGIGGLAIFGLAYAVLNQFLVPAQSGDEAAFLGEAASGTFALFNNPNVLHMANGLGRQPLVLALLLLAPFALLKSDRQWPEKLALAGCYSVVLIPAYYVNTAPYFFAFLLPPVLIAASDAYGWVTRYLDPNRLALICVALAGVTVAAEPPSTMEQQRELRETAAELFPVDTPYFDFPGILGTSAKANPFFSPLVVQGYHEAGQLVIRPIMERRAVPLVIQNHFILESALETRELGYLREPDLAALRGNYFRYWGPFWTAGYELPAGEASHSWEVLVPGRYRVEGGTLAIDGSTYSVGDEVTLDRGFHEATTSQAGARLVWAAFPPAPAEAPPAEPYFVPF